MGMVFLEDGYSWATQLAARSLPRPRGNGIVQRLAGTHVYASVVPVDSEWQAGLRADRFGRNLPRFLDSFPELWASRVWELETSLAHFEQYDFTDRSLDELGGYLRDARTFHRRAWEIHFEVMYPLLANYIGFRGVCGQLGIDPGQISKFLQGYDTKILECDRELWTLTVAARQAGLGDVFARAEAFQLHAVLKAHGGTATGWLARFDKRDDTLFLFWPELMTVLSGAQRYEKYKAVVEQRREYYEHWEARRPVMPKLLGTIPEEVADPILIEIFGIHHHFLDALRAAT